MFIENVRDLEPKAIWNHFEDLNAVPRPSKKEERVRQFMIDFGKSLNLEVVEDKIGNVIIKKPATAGMEDRETVILQSHIDMVHQKNADTVFDFNTQGIESFIENDWVKAKGTTLGADNGMGVAAAMSLLSSTDIKHPRLEALFTIDEETGMTTLSIVLLIGGISSIALMACYLDAKFQWRLNDWMSGECSNPFIKSKADQHQQKLDEKDAQIEKLMRRIETLETIVTEPAYELNKKINAW